MTKRSNFRSRRNGPDNSAVLAADKAIQAEIRKKWRSLKPKTEADKKRIEDAEYKRARKAAKHVPAG